MIANNKTEEIEINEEIFIPMSKEDEITLETLRMAFF